MTEEQLRKLVVSHNKGKSRKYNIGFNQAKQLRNEELRIKNKQNKAILW